MTEPGGGMLFRVSGGLEESTDGMDMFGIELAVIE